MAAIIKHLRAQYYEATIPVQGLRQYHLSEQEIAGLWGTETCHPPLFNIPRHAHDLASFYLVLEGSLTEFYDHNQRDLRTRSVVFTPPGEIHSNAFHNAGGRCFLVELTPRWTNRLAASGIKLESSIDTNNDELTRLATRLYKEFRYVDKASALSVEGLALEILAAFARQTENAPAAYLPGWLRAAKDLLHDRFSETIRLNEIAEFTFEDDRGKQFTLEISPVEFPSVGGSPTMRLLPAAKEQPLYRQKPGERFWFTYLPDSQTVYVSFRGYDSLGENARKLFQFIDSNPTKRLIIDLRQNGGGDFFEGRRHLIQPLKKRPALDKKGFLFVIIGRQTFSAAMVNAIDFRKETNAILVGEPIGERPNSYSENDEMTLPNSRLVVSYSTRYYKFLEEDAPAVMPDKRIDPNWGDFQAGRDPVMDWILSPKPYH